MTDPIEKLREYGLGLARLFDGLSRFDIDGFADADQRHHAHRVVRRALDAVDTFRGYRHYVFLVELALERFDAFREHALDCFHVMSLVGRDEPYRVSGSCHDQVRNEDHRTFVALVEHQDFEFRRMGRASD